jgi:hypothetical protein
VLLLTLQARNDGLSDESAVILVSEGDDFDCAVASVMYHARNLVSATKEANKEWSHELSALVDDFKPEWLEYWFDGLGFCVFLVLFTFRKHSDKLTQHRYMERPWTATDRPENI